MASTVPQCLHCSNFIESPVNDYLKGTLRWPRIQEGPRVAAGMRTLTQKDSNHWHFLKRGSRVTFTNDLIVCTPDSLQARALLRWAELAQRKATLWSCNALGNVHSPITRYQNSVCVSAKKSALITELYDKLKGKGVVCTYLKRYRNKWRKKNMHVRSRGRVTEELKNMKENCY